MLSAQLNDADIVKATRDMVRILIRRPHAYRFRREYPGSPIPGLVLMNHEGKVLDTARLPARGGVNTLLELFED